MKKIVTSVCLCVGLAMPVFAHQLWLERDGNSIREYFGHWPNFKEKADGKRLEAIKGEVVSPKEIYAKTIRHDDHVEIQVKKSGDMAVTEVMPPRKGKMVDFVVRTIFLARNGISESKALIELDLVPESANSTTFTLMFKNQPLPKAKVTLTGPHTWSKNFSTNEQGKVTLSTPWKGDYIVSVDYEDKNKGTLDGVEYVQTNYAMSLFFNVKEGIEWVNPAKVEK